MITLPSRTYLCPEGSPAVEILEELGVIFSEDTEGQRAVQLDPILMIALLALQGKCYPAVSSLIELWKDQETTPEEDTPEENNSIEKGE